MNDEDDSSSGLLANDRGRDAGSLLAGDGVDHRRAATPLADSLSDGRGGRRVLELGLDDDLEAAARVDRFPLAAELLRDPLRIVQVAFRL